MQIVNFRAILRKVSQLIPVEEGLSCNLTLKNLVRFDIKNAHLHLKLTYFWQVISQNMFIGTKKNSFIKIQVYVLVFKIDLAYLTQICPLKVENHAFVIVELADFCFVVSRKIFLRDSILVYFSTLWSSIEVYSKARVDLLNMYWDLIKVPLLRKKCLEDSRTLGTLQISVNKFGILCSWCLWRKHGFVCHCKINQKWFWEKELDYP